MSVRGVTQFAVDLANGSYWVVAAVVKMQAYDVVLGTQQLFEGARRWTLGADDKGPFAETADGRLRPDGEASQAMGEGRPVAGAVVGAAAKAAAKAASGDVTEPAAAAKAAALGDVTEQAAAVVAKAGGDETVPAPALAKSSKNIRRRRARRRRATASASSAAAATVATAASSAALATAAKAEKRQTAQAKGMWAARLRQPTAQARAVRTTTSTPDGREERRRRLALERRAEKARRQQGVEEMLAADEDSKLPELTATAPQLPTDEPRLSTEAFKLVHMSEDLSVAVREEVWALLEEFASVFSAAAKDGPLAPPTALGVFHHIRLKPNAVLERVQARPRRYSRQEAAVLAETLERLKAEGKLRPSFSPVSSAPTMVAKRELDEEGRPKLRMAIDYRALNNEC